MNRKLLSPILIAVISLMTVIPETPGFLAHATNPSATVAVNPSFNAADLGQTFQVALVGTGVGCIVGYDISLTYNHLALSTSPAAVDFDTTTVTAGTTHANIVTVASDAESLVRYAVTTLGGQCLDLSAGANMVIVTFQVIAVADSDLTVSAATIAEAIGGAIVPADVTTSDGTFLVPPKILINAPFSSVSFPTGRAVPPTTTIVRHIKKASDQPVPLIAFIQLDPNAPRGGFGGVTFDVIDPNGVDTPVTSTLAFMFPGDAANVTGVFFFPNVLGAYQVFVTALRCPFPSECVVGLTTDSGLGFKVNP